MFNNDKQNIKKIKNITQIVMFYEGLGSVDYEGDPYQWFKNQWSLSKF